MIFFHYTHIATCSPLKEKVFNSSVQMFKNIGIASGVNAGYAMISNITSALNQATPDKLTAMLIPSATTMCLFMGAGILNSIVKMSFDAIANCVVSSQTQKKHYIMSGLYSCIPSVIVGAGMGMLFTDSFTALCAAVGSTIGIDANHYAFRTIHDYFEDKTKIKLSSELKTALSVISSINSSILGSVVGSQIAQPLANAMNSIHQTIITTNIPPVAQAVQLPPTCESASLSSWIYQDSIQLSQPRIEYNIKNTPADIVYREIGPYNQSVVIAGCDIPLVAISSIDHCLYRDASYLSSFPSDFIFKTSTANLHDFRSDILRLIKEDNCACGEPPFLAVKSGHVAHNETFEAIQIPPDTYPVRDTKDSLLKYFVQFDNVNKTSMRLCESEYAYENTLGCEKIPVTDLELSTCVYTGNIFPTGSYHHVNHANQFQDLVRKACCKQIYSNSTEQACCRQFSGNPVPMNDTFLSFDSMNQDLIQCNKTYILTSNPFIVGCHNTTLTDLSNVLNITCSDYVAIKNGIASQDLKNELLARNCKIDITNQSITIASASTVLIMLSCVCVAGGAGCICYKYKQYKKSNSPSRAKGEVVALL